MKFKWIIFMISVLVLFVACNGKPQKDSGDSKTDGEGFIGYVLQKEDNRILVVDSNVKDYGSSGGMSYFYSAIWFSHGSSEISTGQKVEVWAEGEIRTSYPGQGKAGRISIIQPPERVGGVVIGAGSHS